MISINGTTDLQSRPQSELVKALGTADPTLTTKIKQELALRQLSAIYRRTLAARSGAQIRQRVPRSRQAMSKAAKGAGDLSVVSDADLTRQAVSGSQADQDAALRELGMRYVQAIAATGTDRSDGKPASA